MKKIIKFLKQNYVKIIKLLKQAYEKSNKFLKKSYTKITTDLNRPHNRLFWITLILSAIVFVLILILCKSSINWVPLSVIGALFLMYCFSDTHHHAIMNKEGFLYPLFLTIFVSFTLICTIICLHGEDFTAYDTYYDNKPDKYKWFEVKEILNFPIWQLESRDNPTPQNIDFSTIRDNTPLCHLIIVDQTGSVKNSDTVANKYLIKKITDVFNIADPKIISGYQTSDLIPAYIAANLFENLEKDTANDDNIGFVCFSGINNNFQSLETIGPNKFMYTDTLKVIKKQKQKFILNYFTQSKKYRALQLAEQKRNNAPQITSFNQIFTSFSDYLENKRFRDGKNFHVTIISDFINTDSTEAVPDLYLIKKIKLLNLYILKGYDPKNPITNSPYGLIEKATRKYRFLREIKTIDFRKKENDANFYKNLEIVNFKYFDHKTDSNLFAYYPYRDFHTQKEAVARLTFKDLKKADRIYLKIGNLDHPNDLFQFSYYLNSDSSKSVVVDPNELTSVSVKASDILNIRMPSAINYKDDRLFVEISTKRANKMESRMISVLPLLSAPASYFLLILYLVFVISISLVLILTNSFVFCLMNRREIKYPHLFHSFIMAISTGLGLAILLFFYIELCTIFSLKDISISFAVLIVLLSFSSSHLRRDLKNFNKEEKRFTPFLKWITERIEQYNNEILTPIAATANNTNFSTRDAAIGGEPSNNDPPVKIKIKNETNQIKTTTMKNNPSAKILSAKKNTKPTTKKDASPTDTPPAGPDI